jgi:hypothetical protein
MKRISLASIFLFCLFNSHSVTAQENSQNCKVLDENLTGTYKGDCINGIADGKGEAKGRHSYTGPFKNGMPNGTGIYTYADNMYYNGNFQDGVKEGKGEFHYLRNGLADSIVKGYWSGNEYRGKKYTTYSFEPLGKYDRLEIIPSNQSGNSLTFEISTTTAGTPAGGAMGTGSRRGYDLFLYQLTAQDNAIVKFISKFESGNSSSSTYEISSFPVTLNGTLSNGETFKIELYKAAHWKVRIFVNK